MNRQAMLKGFGLLILLLGFLGVLIALGRWVDSQRQATAPKAPVAANSIPDPFAAMAPGEHVTAALKALDEDDRNPDVSRRHWGNLTLAEKHLGYITVNDAEWDKSREIRNEIDRRKRLIELAIGKMLRAKAAEDYEKKNLLNGMDTRVRVDGPWNTTLYLKYALMSRPLAYKLMNEGDFLASMRTMGFVRIHFSNGFEYPMAFQETWNTGLPEPEPEPKAETNAPKTPIAKPGAAKKKGQR
jgi:hypothetical protein